MEAGKKIWHKVITPNKGRLSMAALLAIMAFLPLHSQFVEISTGLDTNQVLIGEHFHLEIDVLQPAGLNVLFPPIMDTLMENVEVLQVFPPDTLAEEENLKIHQRIRLTSFDSGFYEIPPMMFYIRSDQWIDSLESNPIYLLVHSVAVGSTIYDVKAPIHMPVSFLEVFPFVMGGLVIAAGIFFLVWYLRKRKKERRGLKSDKPGDPAHVIALHELDELKEKKLWQRSEFKAYYTRLTEIIRWYLERRYNIPAMEMTSYEIMDTWKRNENQDDDLAGKLNRLLNLADLVKFAKEKPIASDNEENLHSAYDFVKKTMWVQKMEEAENDE